MNQNIKNKPLWKNMWKRKLARDTARRHCCEGEEEHNKFELWRRVEKTTFATLFNN